MHPLGSRGCCPSGGLRMVTLDVVPSQLKLPIGCQKNGYLSLGWGGLDRDPPWSTPSTPFHSDLIQ